MQVKLQGDICMIQGAATRDAEYKVAGAKSTRIVSFSLAVGKNPDDSTIFANCKAFHRLAEYGASIKKSDSVLCIGKVQEREYNGKTYKDFICEWLNVASAANPAPTPQPAAASTPQPTDSADVDIDDDGDLPF